MISSVVNGQWAVYLSCQIEELIEREDYRGG